MWKCEPIVIEPRQELSIEQLWQQIDMVLELMQLNRTLGDLIASSDQDFSRPLENLTDCYAFEVIDDQNRSTFINIFDKNRQFNDIVKFFYQAFPDNDLTPNSIWSLLSSTQEIIFRCLQMENFPETNPQLKFGFTELSDKDGNYMRRMNGLGSSYYHNRRPSSSSSSTMDDSYRECLRKSRNLPENFDWRDRNVVTPVKNQGSCGSCWAFATAASIESAYLINNRNNSIDLSEQELVSCAKPNGCQGGTSSMAFDFVRRYGLTSEQIMPYRARSSSCRRLPSSVVDIRNYCVRSKLRYTSGSRIENLNDDDIQNALVTFGPLYIGVNADRLSRNYRGGIVDDRSCPKQINHAVVLVGYTPAAWILKNTWGRSWGERGYFRLARRQNICGVNTEIAYPII
ncbi:hypothetical protein DERP_011690 [Dermatophagoides pteronyssinus]|uniref:Peptidase C1A papain C-terminal domain-containing protein n=1 Tax=Dermatophagoides pteronyssinus TaxID=6956 RepID=A0ABQ8J302_DERPT|nr:hypothetical protein DERP_011690 [Dermatophagoides pteronyssinus]